MAGLVKKVDITGGPLMRSILTYAVPIMLGSFIQVAFNAADLAVVGNMADENAVASVGATTVITSLLVTSFIGLSAGATAILARCIGQRNGARASRVVSTAMIFSAVLGLLVTVLAFSLAGPMLRLMDCPVECFDGAVLYLRIYSLGIPALMMYNFGVGIIRTTGDSQKPFLYIVCAGILNVVLNFVLCLIIEQKVAAVAIATAASQYLGGTLTLIHLTRLKGDCSLNLRKLSFSFHELWGILKIGAPCAFNSALYSLSNLQMGAAINSYGAEAVAGNSAATTTEGMVSSFCTGFTAAIVPFVGQNVGSGNKKRVRKSILYCGLISATVALTLSQGIFFFRHEILGMYLPNSEAAVEFGIERMKYVLLMYPISALFNVCTSSLQAFGYSFIPMINSVLTVFVFRIVWLEFIYPPLDAANRAISNVYMCYSFSWLLTLLAHATMFIIIYVRYLKGKVKEI